MYLLDHRPLRIEKIKLLAASGNFVLARKEINFFIRYSSINLNFSSENFDDNKLKALITADREVGLLMLYIKSGSDTLSNAGYKSMDQIKTFHVLDNGTLAAPSKNRFVELSMGSNLFNRSQLQADYNESFSRRLKAAALVENDRMSYKQKLNDTISKAQIAIASHKLTLQKIGPLPVISQAKDTKKK